VVLDDHEGIGMGSRAICFAKRTLEVAARYGCGDEMLDKGVIWNVGKVFHKDRKVFEFNLLPEDGHRYPAFINLQQPYFEKFLVDGSVRHRPRVRRSTCAAKTAWMPSRSRTTTSCSTSPRRMALTGLRPNG
jgi:2-polyprenyl-6-methoxyphenol hydroxylase-like FAD-dependent oxidoreductase